jgi:hypothetical protein
MKSASVACLSLLLAQAILWSGCTAALWEQDRFARYHQPATPPNLQLVHSAGADDILVRYDEKRAGSKKTVPRAYWLRGEGEPAGNPYKPHFVPVKGDQQLAPIPLLDPADPIPTLDELYAVADINAHDFTLYSGEDQVGKFELPEYMDNDGRAKQVLLTPLAVIVDLVTAAIVVAVLVYVADSNYEE